MTLTEQKVAAKKFATKWANRGDEKQDTRSFWEEFMEDVLGIEGARDVIFTEYPVDINGHQKYIDVFYKEQEILIEQKSVDKPLNKRYHQSGGDMLTPFEQGRRYAGYLPYGINTRWIIACNFRQFEIHDLKRPGDPPLIVELSNLAKDIGLFRFFYSDKNEDIKRETEISKDAGVVVGRLYDALLEKYINPDDEETQRQLNILVTRLVFCMYAEDAGLFGDDLHRFENYLKSKEPEDLGEALERLFRVLDMPKEKRQQKSNIPSYLMAFPYVNGGLFKETNIEIPVFDEDLKRILVDDACAFNWAEISPTIFGAVFESTLNPETRRSNGMHYTSIENIHKVIDPLFLDDLKRELREIQATSEVQYYKNRLLKFQKKLASLKFLDPACGSGNFLTESFLCLRKLENIIFSELIAKKQIEGQMAMAGVDDSVYQTIEVSISQFYGIEINDFAVTVAKTALWIAEAQMYEETQKIFFQADQTLPEFFPLTTNATIVEGNAVQLDWGDIINHNELNYIMGNPPFVANSGRVSSDEGSSSGMMSEEQKRDRESLFGKKGNVLDYVSCWIKKASDYIEGTRIECAFVATNSVCQGQQVEPLWKPLMDRGIIINYAWPSFKWNSEAKGVATVYVVIIGFSFVSRERKYLFYGETSNPIQKEANNINAYLVDAPNVIVSKKKKPFGNASEMASGGKPTENGFLILSEQEKNSLIKKEPFTESWIRPFMMGKDFIQRKPRYCLWLVDVPPNELNKSSSVKHRIESVKEYRLSSSKAATRMKASTPHLFDEIKDSKTYYIAVPKVTSGNRRYIPMDYLPPDVIPGDKLFKVPDASLYTFGIMTSNVHMAWARTVCSTYGPSYSYSNLLAYNNFPWPEVSDTQKERIAKSAQEILDARNKYPDADFAVLYDETLMPIELRKAHQKNDMAVMEAYGFYSVDDSNKKHWFSEDETVAALMKQYLKLTQPKEDQSSCKKAKATIKVKVHKKQ